MPLSDGRRSKTRARSISASVTACHDDGVGWGSVTGFVAGFSAEGCSDGTGSVADFSFGAGADAVSAADPPADPRLAAFFSASLSVRSGGRWGGGVPDRGGAPPGGV